ncbi:MAG: ribonuclease III [Ruthenibacterium sp.]
MDYEALERVLGHTFQDKALLETALTHTSFANEARHGTKHNERTGFLGDSVLSIVVAEYLFTHSSLPEGDLTRMRASLVCEAALFTFAQKIGLGRWLRLGHGEEMGGGRTRPSVVSDAFEAVIAALYLDGGIDAARAFILPFVTSALTKQSAEEDYKTKLQEVVQQNPSERLRYVVASQTGPDHDKHFVVEVHLNSNCIGSGEGHSKKQAEQAAAKEALALMGY